MKSHILLIMVTVVTIFTGCSEKQTSTQKEKISCIFDSKRTALTEMFMGLTDDNVGKNIVHQKMLIDTQSDRNHIHVVFVEGGGFLEFTAGEGVNYIGNQGVKAKNTLSLFGVFPIEIRRWLQLGCHHVYLGVRSLVQCSGGVPVQSTIAVLSPVLSAQVEPILDCRD